ncbi:hypothetical protein BaRGS_00031309 [Batillaria attramentaria]|uniref:Uncharacterized protein n=1 Tax=Batillaria attramentaria TaxID=370345 RepID=A0ABD0JS55_9CAEN
MWWTVLTSIILYTCFFAVTASGRISTNIQKSTLQSVTCIPPTSLGLMSMQMSEKEKFSKWGLRLVPNNPPKTAGGANDSRTLAVRGSLKGPNLYLQAASPFPVVNDLRVFTGQLECLFGYVRNKYEISPVSILQQEAKTLVCSVDKSLGNQTGNVVIEILARLNGTETLTKLGDASTSGTLVFDTHFGLDKPVLARWDNSAQVARLMVVTTELPSRCGSAEYLCRVRTGDVEKDVPFKEQCESDTDTAAATSPAPAYVVPVAVVVPVLVVLVVVAAVIGYCVRKKRREETSQIIPEDLDLTIKLHDGPG